MKKIVNTKYLEIITTESFYEQVFLFLTILKSKEK